MRVAVVKEVKNNEFRVALTPPGVHALCDQGHQVLVESGAGIGSGIPDAEYAAQGATIVGTDDAWAADLVVKVKEPVASEYHYLRPELTLFTYLHLAADRPLTERLLASGTTALAYETVQLPSGLLPLLYPMSEVAGCLAPQAGAHALQRAQGGRGILLGGVVGAPNAKVVVLGGGVAGQNAINIALGMGAQVTVLDTDIDKLRLTFWRHGNRAQTLVSNPLTVREQVLGADLVIGTVLIPGARTPRLVTHAMVTEMKPGSVLVDVAVDQGGCFEDSRPTTHDDPTFTVANSVFYCVANMPGAVPATSTTALTNATLPYVTALARGGWRDACGSNEPLARGLNTVGGTITCPGVADAFPDLPARPVAEALA